MALYLKAAVGIVLLCTVESMISLRSSVRLLQVNNEDRFSFFDVELLEAICKEEKGNVVISPASVKALLAMVLEGARGNSEQEIRAALRLHNPRQDTRLLFRKYLTSLQAHGNGYMMELANRIFASSSSIIYPEFQNNLRKFYVAEIQKTDFSESNTAANTINDWINVITHGLIPKLVDPDDLSGNAQLLLANALYFKGLWKTSFDKESTTEKCFYTNGECQLVHMMESLDIYRYGNIEALDAQAIELPYKDEKFSMLIILPNKKDGIWQLVRDIPHSPITSILATLQPIEIVVNLPQFKLDYSTDLVAVLQKLQIKSIFNAGADLSGMMKDSNGSYIGNVLHKAKIEVNEEGSVAGAGTGALVIPLMGSNFLKFNVDHPFLFFIRNTATGSFIFAGRFMEPEKVKPVVSSKPSVQNNMNIEEPTTISDSINKQTQQTKPFMNTENKPPPNTKPVNQIGPQLTNPLQVTGTERFSNGNPQYITVIGMENSAPYYNYSSDSNDTKAQYQQPQPSDKDGIHFSGGM